MERRPNAILYGADPIKVMPLSEFPSAHRQRIADLVAEPFPPDRWIKVVGGAIPSRAWWEWHWQRGIHPERRRPKLSRTLRRLVIERDGLVCGICTGRVDLADIHIDHIFPVSLGGSDAMSNLRVTHKVCNLRKAAKV